MVLGAHAANTLAALLLPTLAVWKATAPPGATPEEKAAVWGAKWLLDGDDHPWSAAYDSTYDSAYCYDSTYCYAEQNGAGNNGGAASSNSAHAGGESAGIFFGVFGGNGGGGRNASRSYASPAQAIADAIGGSLEASSAAAVA